MEPTSCPLAINATFKVVLLHNITQPLPTSATSVGFGVRLIVATNRSYKRNVHLVRKTVVLSFSALCCNSKEPERPPFPTLSLLLKLSTSFTTIKRIQYTVVTVFDWLWNVPLTLHLLLGLLVNHDVMKDCKLVLIRPTVVNFNSATRILARATVQCEQQSRLQPPPSPPPTP